MTQWTQNIVSVRRSTYAQISGPRPSWKIEDPVLERG